MLYKMSNSYTHGRFYLWISNTRDDSVHQRCTVTHTNHEKTSLPSAGCLSEHSYRIPVSCVDTITGKGIGKQVLWVSMQKAVLSFFVTPDDAQVMKTTGGMKHIAIANPFRCCFGIGNPIAKMTIFPNNPGFEGVI
jgi:hypothetical protein